MGGCRSCGRSRRGTAVCGLHGWSCLLADAAPCTVHRPLLGRWLPPCKPWDLIRGRRCRFDGCTPDSRCATLVCTPRALCPHVLRVTRLQVLTPMHRGQLGTDAINRALQVRSYRGAATLVFAALAQLSPRPRLPCHAAATTESTNELHGPLGNVSRRRPRHAGREQL